MSEQYALPDRSILVVEDEFLVRELAVCELEDAGFRVIDFCKADDALAHLAGHAADTAVVFTDVQMPGMLSGLDLADIVSRRWPGLPVLVTSGGALIDPSRLPPCAAFVPKPWRGTDIVRRIEELSIHRCEVGRRRLARAGRSSRLLDTR